MYVDLNLTFTGKTDLLLLHVMGKPVIYSLFLVSQLLENAVFAGLYSFTVYLCKLVSETLNLVKTNQKKTANLKENETKITFILWLFLTKKVSKEILMSQTFCAGLQHKF